MSARLAGWSQEGIDSVLELIQAGGWLIWPILLSSVVALAIVVERFWSLQTRRIMPENLVAQVWQWAHADVLDDKRIEALRAGSTLGRVVAAGLINRHHDRMVMKEGIEEVVIALGTDVESDATASYLKEILSTRDVKVSRIAFGLPAGSAIEYSDATTLAKAIKGRQEFE